MNATIPPNKDQIAIVVVGYNRKKSISRLLDSLLHAKYPNMEVPLIISIDCSGDEELYKYVRSFNWPYGDKFVNIQTERLGLKNHIFQCGDLSKLFKAVILFEDDLYVSPYFFNYVVGAVEKYGNNDQIAEISLYKNETNGFAGLPFVNVQNGSDVFLMQDVSTWGQCWTEQMWNRFVEWRDSHSEEDIQKIDMPERIKKWERAWSKYYNAYVVDTRKHVLYPNISLTTNFSDAGEHGGTQNSAVQVNLLQGEINYHFKELDELIRYDIFANNESIPEWLGIKPQDICLDIYGIHPNNGKRYILSACIYPYKVVESFALYMRPIELNVKYHIKGDGIYLYDTSVVTKNKKNKQPKYGDKIVLYFINNCNPSYITGYFFRRLKERIKRKLRITK